MPLGQKLMEFANAHGISKTTQFFQESLQKGRITMEQVSFRNLAEATMGHNWPDRLKEARMIPLMESTSPIGPSLFTAISGQLLVDETWKGWGDPAFIGRKLVRVIPCGPNLGEHTVPGHSQVLDDAGEVQPGENYPRTKFRGRFKVLPKPVKKGLICELTFEAIYSDLVGDRAEAARTVGWRVRYEEEEDILSVVMGNVNNYKEAVGGNDTASAKNTYQTSDWTNSQTGKTLNSFRPIQELRTLMQRITDPDTGKRIPFVGDYPLLVMPEREWDASIIKTAREVRVTDGDLTNNGEQTLAGNPLKGVSEILSSPIAEQLQIDAGVSTTNLKDYFWHGPFSQSFILREVFAPEVQQAPPMNPDEYNRDVVLSVKCRRFNKAGVWEPRNVGFSKNA